MQKKIVLEFVFEETVDEDDWAELELVSIARTHSDLSDDELDGLGESIAQTDSWQVDHWNEIQLVLGGQAEKIDV